ncbi:MAG TPA: tetraacyldisaccharide 4'-kinase, partial [Glaciecola sp.]|nr:tetraacyldisaccharide 4'-kinase [Glaciecola sp.]
MTFIEKAWKKQSLWLYLLAPFSLLFWLLSTLRRTLFKVGIKTTHRLPVPVVVVGNISVGGNGKTPAVLAIVEHLQ